jgi:hypothetical protein
MTPRPVSNHFVHFLGNNFVEGDRIVSETNTAKTSQECSTPTKEDWA